MSAYETALAESPHADVVKEALRQRDRAAQLEVECERMRAERGAAVEALRPFALLHCRLPEDRNDAIVPVHIDFTHEEAVELCREIDAHGLPIMKPGIDPHAPDAGMHWPRHSLSMDSLVLGHFRRARTVLAEIEGKS